MKHKTIAMCVTGYDPEYESLVVNGVHERCSVLGINLLVFSPMTKKPELNSGLQFSESIIKGETEIYNLIDFSSIDGLILMGDSFITRDCIPVLEEKAKKNGVPVININDTEYLLEHNVLLSDKAAMKFPVKHLIEKHNKTRIGFIGGFPGNVQTEERLAAYKSVLEESGIPFDRELVTYGEFWKKAAECTEKLMSLENKPDAIACASDSMAFFCMDKLKELGYRIPEDIAVTGFDGIKDCDEYSPRLTSVRRDHKKAGSEAVNVLSKIWNGENAAVTTYVDSKIIIRESCGCHGENDVSADFYSERYSEVFKLKEFNSYTTYSNAVFAGSENSAELFGIMSKGADFFSFNRMFVCISPQCESISSFTGQSGRNFIGISDKMLSMVQYGHNVPIYTEFDTKSMVPADILNEEKPVFFAFSPMYFKNRFLGYVAFEPTKNEGEGDLFGIWLLNISHNAGSFYMNKALETLYVRDHLTGLYNRHGMEQFGNELLKEAKEKHTTFTVICADIDRLKPINDTYGHEAGDNTILQTANAIRLSMNFNGICIRTGGDEFCILASDCSNDVITEYLYNIERYLEKYNSDSGLPYQVNCSCGFVTVSADEIDDITKTIYKADENMYIAKYRKKTINKS
ncbi:MAG: GGDEF domain-containing protein [Huintestinicola sp.]